MRIAIAQLNPTVGDVAGNVGLVLDAISAAKRAGAKVLVTSELALIGYPPRDLLLRQGIVETCEAAVQTISEAAGDLYIIVGHPRRCAGGARSLRNSASVCHIGKVVGICDKQLLPGYDVFDEDRYFEPGGRSCLVEILGRKVGVVICEDLWRANDVLAERRYPIEPVAELAAQECDLIISLNASPYVIGKWQRHLDQLREIATDLKVSIVAVNQAGANDDLIFDGRSVLVDAAGTIQAALSGFESAVQIVDTEQRADSSTKAEIRRWDDANREVFHALTLGVRDYCSKTGHTTALIGLSGGIDSALTAVIASAALGPANVHGLTMPSQYSSRGSIDDSIELARWLGLAKCHEISIEELHQAMRSSLSASLEQTGSGTVDENVQARLRGIILMAHSNAMPRSLVLATSNKSEIATGYNTLYGDMCGAIAVLGDVLKTRIYALSRWVNINFKELGFKHPPIPEASISKPPSAELRPNQTDQDTLPPYEVLDEIIERFIEREQSAEMIVLESGINRELVYRTLKMIDRAQYKRSQAPVVLKITPRAFGPGRPMPIVMRSQEQASRDLGPVGRESVHNLTNAAAPTRESIAQQRA